MKRYGTLYNLADEIEAERIFKKILLVTVAALLLCIGIWFVGCEQASALTSTEHGFKGRIVEATRYKNPVMGPNIGFTGCTEIDRVEVGTIIESHGGVIYQGDFSGIFVIFKGVVTREQMNVKIKEVVPLLDAFLVKAGCR